MGAPTGPHDEGLWEGITGLTAGVRKDDEKFMQLDQLSTGEFGTGVRDGVGEGFVAWSSKPWKT